MFEIYLLLAIIFVPVIAFCLYIFNKDWKKCEEYDRYGVSAFKKH